MAKRKATKAKAKAKHAPEAPETPARPLRLEWIEAGSLAENPANWRRHPDGQMGALRDVLNDPEIGWAGACLYNSRTSRLIDGHARRNAVDPATPIPVLVGNWSEAAEKKILLTLDPLASLAAVDAAALASLMDTVQMGEALAVVTDTLAQELEALQLEGEQTTISDAPESVRDNVAELETIKQQRRDGNEKVGEKNDTEKYLVIVYPSREAKVKALKRLGLPHDERYVPAACVVLKARSVASGAAVDAGGRSTKAADPTNSGACG